WFITILINTALRVRAPTTSCRLRRKRFRARTKRNNVRQTKENRQYRIGVAVWQQQFTNRRKSISTVHRAKAPATAAGGIWGPLAGICGASSLPLHLPQAPASGWAWQPLP